MRNAETNILKVIAIFMVVVNHVGIRPFDWFPVASFSIALFFFISGSFFKEVYEDDLPELIRRRAKKLLLPYLLYYIFYCLISFLLVSATGWTGINKPLTLYNLLVDPFILGGYSGWMVAAWFLPQLFILQIVFAVAHRWLKKVIKSRFALLLLFLGLAMLGTTLAREGWNTGFGITLIRTLYGLFFFYLGYYYRNVLENKPIFRAVPVYPDRFPVFPGAAFFGRALGPQRHFL
jgi:fucose 4-O-acetylase-like acetyltransferase